MCSIHGKLRTLTLLGTMFSHYSSHTRSCSCNPLLCCAKFARQSVEHKPRRSKADCGGVNIGLTRRVLLCNYLAALQQVVFTAHFSTFGCMVGVTCLFWFQIVGDKFFCMFTKAG